MLDASSRPSAGPASPPGSGPRHYLMCRPEHFDVVYVINPWMDPEVAVDRTRALAQWDALRAAYEAAGHRVDVIESGAGLPDMVFAANSALVIDDTALLARFRFAERKGEERLYARWFRDHGFKVRRAASRPRR